MPKHIDKKQGIYISLDALLDTRMPVLEGLGDGVLLGALENGYFTRTVETFHGVEKEVWDKAWKERTRDALTGAVVCRTINFVNEIIIKLNSEAKHAPYHTGPKIFLNIFPYEMSEEEIEALLVGVSGATRGACDIQVVNMSYEELTPVWCDENVAIMFMYEHNEWLDIQHEAFAKKPITGVSLIVPGIYFVRAPTTEELREALRNRMHPMREVEMLASVWIALKFQDIELFCANIPIKKKAA